MDCGGVAPRGPRTWARSAGSKRQILPNSHGSPIVKTLPALLGVLLIVLVAAGFGYIYSGA